MREIRTYGSVRGALSDGRPYRDPIRSFSSVRLRNLLAPGTEGGVTRDFTHDGEVSSIYDASVNYAAAGIPLVVLAGKDRLAGSALKMDHGVENQVIKIRSEKWIERQGVQIERVDPHCLPYRALVATPISREHPWVAEEQCCSATVEGFGPDRIESRRPIECVGRFARLPLHRGLADPVVCPRIIAVSSGG